MASSKILLITGVSSGFGRALAQEALAAGHKVVGTVRSAQAKLDFEYLSAGAAFGRVLDVTDCDAINGIVAEIEATVGPVDVLVNNAGYGHEGVMEESPLSEMRRQFEVNVFGAVAMIKAVLPSMRERRRGHILNITSMGGYHHARDYLLLWKQIRAGGHLRGAWQRGQAFRHRRDSRRARLVSHRLGGSLDDTNAPFDCGLRPGLRPHPQSA